VTSTSVRIGGNSFDAAIADYIRKEYALAIGERTAEDIKIRIGAAMYLEDKLYMEIKGRDMISGLPRTLEINSDDITQALQNDLDGIMQAIKSVLYDTPPELSADIMDKGMIFSGGSSLLRNIDALATKVTQVPAFIAEDPLLCVAKGTGVALDNLDSYKRSILAAR